jgi:hypothetical protein
MIADAGQIAYPATPNQDNRVFLKVVALAGNIGGDFHAARKPHPRNFP